MNPTKLFRQPPINTRLYPVTSELLRRASQPCTIEIDTVDLRELWQFDVIPRQKIRQQVKQLVRLAAIDDLTRCNLAIVCGHWTFWGDTTVFGLAQLRKFESLFSSNAPASSLNYWGLRAKAEASAGLFSAALKSLQTCAGLLQYSHTPNDLLYLNIRLSLICDKVGLSAEALRSARISFDLTRSAGDARHLGHARYQLALSLLLANDTQRALAYFNPLLQDVIKGAAWIDSHMLPRVPLMIANAQFRAKQPHAVDTLLAQSREFESGHSCVVTEMLRTLSNSQLAAASNQDHRAKVHLQDFALQMLQSDNINLGMTRYSFDLQHRLGDRSNGGPLSQLQEWAEDIRPDMRRWQQTMQTLLKQLGTKTQEFSERANEVQRATCC